MRASRIHKNLEVANRMEPYASRLRLRLKHFDVSDPKKKQRLANARREMTKILVKKKVHPDEARRAVTRTLDIAADHLLEVLRRDQNLQGLSRPQRDLRRLIKQLDHLRLAISTLPPLAKSKLNKIVAEQDWQNFDTETLGATSSARRCARTHTCVKLCSTEMPSVAGSVLRVRRIGHTPRSSQNIRPAAKPLEIDLNSVLACTDRCM
jgi:hypothetical protein